MKARFLFTLVGFGALALGLGSAGEPSNQAVQRAPSQNRARTTSERTSDAGDRVQPPAARAGQGRADRKPLDGEQHGSHASAKSGQTNGTKATAKGRPGPKLPQPFQRSGEHPGEKRTNNGQTKGALGNAAALHQPALNKPGQVVHRVGPGPASLGGPASPRAGNTAVLNGTGMRRKP